MSSRTRWLIVAFAVLGLGFAGMSSWVHYRSLTDPTYVSPCDINSRFNCTELYKSQYGSVAGVPVALAGVLWFALVGLVAGFARPAGPGLPEDSRKSAAAGYIFALSVIGLAVVLYLAYVSSAVMRTWCLLCIGTYVSVVAIFLLSSFTSTESMTRLPVRLFSDLAAALARPVTLVVTLAVVAGAATVIAFFPRENEMAERAQAAANAAPLEADVQKNFAEAWAKQPRIDLGINPEGAKIVIVKFNDYECPACGAAETAYRPVLDKFAAAHPGAVKYVMKDWPWNKNCNFNITSTIPGHEAACDAAVAARIARDRGKYEEMAAWLFSHLETTPESVRQEAARILVPLDFDREYAAKLPDIRRDIADGGVLRITATPTYFINGVRLPEGLMPVQYFEMALNLELERP
jgi:uncharacterized membrane protein/protein-disulfide isomerase